MDQIIQSFYVAKRAKSTNYYNTCSPFLKHRHMREMEEYVIKSIEEYNVKPIPAGYIIEFTWHPIIKTGNKERAYDMVNYSSSIKMIEDWLKKLNIIIDDDEKYVVGHTTKKTIRNKDYETGFLIIMKAFKEDKDYDKRILKLIGKKNVAI